MLCYLLGMGFAKVVNVIVELNQKKHIPKVIPSPVIKIPFSNQEIFERSSFPNSKTSLTNMCEPDRAIYKLTTLELTDVPILGETSLDSIIKDNIKDFETIALTESEYKFLNTFKEQVIDVKA